jgi:quercetin dioxygenase-like cupin family protein
METRYNEATKNRPEGTRMIDGPAIFTDLVAVTKQLYGERAWATNDLNGITVFKTDQMTVVLTVIKEGTKIKKNAVEGLFMIVVLKGKLLVVTDDEDYILENGNMLNLHPQVSHSITAKKETVLLQVTSHLLE